MIHTAEDEDEIWEQVKEFGTGLHYISNLGRLKRMPGFLRTKSKRFALGMYLKPSMRGEYLSFPRMVNGVTKNFNLHILVAKYFVANPFNKPQVNHKNGNKRDCRASNLEWATHSENELHSYRVLGKKPNKTALGKFGANNKLSVKVKCVESGVVYPSLGDAAKDNNVSRSAICLVLKGKNKTANKKKFIYHLDQIK